MTVEQIKAKTAHTKARVKAHLSENKKAYLGFAGGVATTVAALYFGSKTNHDVQTLQKIYQIAWRPDNVQKVINLVERSTPSKPVHLKGTNLYFSSLNEAARETGHSLTRISQNVNGQIPHVKGDVFELLQPAA